MAYLDRSRELCEIFTAPAAPRQVHVASSQYLILYVLIDAVRRFHAKFPQIRIRLSTLTEQARSKTVSVARSGDRVGRRRPLRAASRTGVHAFILAQLEPDRTARAPIAPPKKLDPGRSDRRAVDPVRTRLDRRQHVVDGFHVSGLSPRAEMETTNTEIIVRMVEAGPGRF